MRGQPSSGPASLTQLCHFKFESDPARQLWLQLSLSPSASPPCTWSSWLAKLESKGTDFRFSPEPFGENRTAIILDRAWCFFNYGAVIHLVCLDKTWKGHITRQNTLSPMMDGLPLCQWHIFLGGVVKQQALHSCSGFLKTLLVPTVCYCLCTLHPVGEKLAAHGHSKRTCSTEVKWVDLCPRRA